MPAITKATVIATLQRDRPTLEKMGVRSLLLFGSIARNQAHDQSDIDLLVKLDKNCSLFDLFRVRRYLETQFNRAINLGTIDALREHAREPILEESIHVF